MFRIIKSARNQQLEHLQQMAISTAIRLFVTPMGQALLSSTSSRSWVKFMLVASVTQQNGTPQYSLLRKFLKGFGLPDDDILLISILHACVCF